MKVVVIAAAAADVPRIIEMQVWKQQISIATMQYMQH